MFLALPSTLTQQASWEFDLAMCDLEAGMPEDAATHFTQALTLAPELGVRPIAAYYLEKLGKPVPALKPNTATAIDDRTASKAPGNRIIPGPTPTGQPVLPSGTPKHRQTSSRQYPRRSRRRQAQHPTGGKEPTPK